MRSAQDNYWLWSDAGYKVGVPLAGDHESDITIIGGGYTGLASAYFMKKRFPEKKIIVLESNYIGFGASGRNSGVVTGMMNNSALLLKKTIGIEKALILQKLAHKAYTIVDEFIKEYRIDCDYETIGRLVLAESDNARKKLEKEAKACEEIKAPVPKWLEKQEAIECFGALNASAAIYTPEEGMLNPAKHVRGLKRVVESLGVEVYEHSPCTHIETGSKIRLYTPLARLTAANIVIATNAYPNPLELFKYKVNPFYVYNIVTEPLTDQQLKEFRWRGRTVLFNQKNLFWAMRLTADNRLVFINNNALYFYKVNCDYTHRPKEYQSHYNLLINNFPFLKGIRVTHQWGGRIGITLDNLPAIGRVGKYENIYYSMGYTGHGLTFSHIAGKMLSELMAGEKTELTDNMLINKSVFGVPSGLITYAAIHSLLSYYKIKDRLDI